MTQSPAKDTMTLAGLAAANGPWLAVRLHRLSEHSGLALAPEVVENAVVSTSQVLAEIMNAEGRPVLNMDAATDAAVALGREQAQGHRQAGLAMADSLKVQRLLRRSYDDLVRESWVEKDTRARAHEDVERFFERALVGLVGVWTGQPLDAQQSSAPAYTGEESPAKLLARREDELRRALEAAQRVTLALRQSRERADTLDAELSQALMRLQEQTRLNAERAAEPSSQELAGLKAQLEQAREELRGHEDLKAQLAEIKAQAGESLSGLKGQLARLKEQAGESLAGLKAEYESAMAQAQAQAEAEQQSLSAHIRNLEAERATLGARLAELEMALAAHGDAEIARIEAQEELERARKEADRARDKAERARTELQQLQESAQDLRLSAERQALSAGAETEGLRRELQQLREDYASLSSEAEAMRLRLTETGSRMAETRQADDQAVQAGLAQAADTMAQAQARMAELEGQLRQAEQDGQARCAALEAERDAERVRAREYESQGVLLAEALRRTRVELAAVKADAVAESAGESDSGKAAALAQKLEQARKALAQSETRRIEAEQRAAEAVARTGGILQEAKAQCMARLEEMAASRETSARLLASHLSLTGDAVAAVDAVDPAGRFLAWNKRFSALFGLGEAALSQGLGAVAAELAAATDQPEAFQARLRELLAQPERSEEGMALRVRGAARVFRSVVSRSPKGAPLRVLHFALPQADPESA